MPLTIYTIGHSTHPLEVFVRLLRAHGVKQVADVRTFPGSRRQPHFSRERLEPALAAAGIGYRHFPELGGFRRPRPDSPNIGWRHPSFRGYADHMRTAEFAAGLTNLLSWSDFDTTALMCADARWWQCHRSLLADALVVRGRTVRHITALDRAEPHQLCDFARTDGDTITYVEDTSVTRRMRGNHPGRRTV